MKLFSSFSLTLIGAALVSADPIQDSLETNSAVLVKFYTKWCGHCTRFAPTFDQVLETFSNSNVDVLRIECDENRELCHKYEVRGYPTVKLFTPETSEQGIAFIKARSLENVVSFVHENVQVETVNREDDEEDDNDAKDEDENEKGDEEEDEDAEVDEYENVGEEENDRDEDEEENDEDDSEIVTQAKDEL